MHTTSSQPDSIQSLFIKTGYKTEQILLDGILFIEGMRNYIKIFTVSDGCITTHMSMKSIEEKLPASNFIRVHRSFIVNLGKVKTIERSRIVFGKTRIPISENYKDSFNLALSSRSLIVT